METKIIERDIIELLKDIGLKMSIKGFSLWVDAIKYVLQNPHYTMRKIYINVGICKNYCRNERAMRHVIEGLDLNNYFHVDYKIKNRDFLALCIYKLKKNKELED